MRVEWLKLKGYKPFWFFTALYPICVCGSLLIALAFYLKVKAQVPTDLVSKTLPFAFPTIWKTSAYAASFFHFFPAIILLLSICNEFEFRTFRQAILNGASRAQLFFSQWILSLLCCLFSTSVVASGAFLIGLTQGNFSVDSLDSLPRFFLQAWVYSQFCVCLGFTLRHGLGALASFLVYTTVLESFLFFLMDRGLQGISSYAPLSMANQLVLFPVNLPGAFSLAKLPLTTLVLGSLTYSTLFTALAWLQFQRRDL